MHRQMYVPTPRLLELLVASLMLPIMLPEAQELYIIIHIANEPISEGRDFTPGPSHYPVCQQHMLCQIPAGLELIWYTDVE